MASTVSSRPTRRAAARRNIIVDEPTEDLADAMDGVEQEGDANPDSDAAPMEEEGGDEEEDFTPAPTKRSPKKQPSTVRRRTTKSDLDPDATPVPKARTRRTRGAAAAVAPETAAEASENLDPELTMKSPPTSPSKRGASRRSKVSMAPTTKGRTSNALPTPEPSVTPEPVSTPMATPLTDITARTNGQSVAPTPATEFAKMRPLDTILEKPMDIVVRTRALGVPQVKEPEAPKARTVIQYLNLTNFKSYAGRQEVGPFHASFSSVVGPNGSGKSNVIDSLLFVFGFRASKMRQGKISALIHNSATHPNLDFCEVEVIFQEVMDLPGGKHEIMPDSNLVIARRAYKNNSSDYLINGKKSNFTEVTTLLREKGVDLDHKRFLILQGEVESIAQMKPKAQGEHDDGLLEYLEDIIGTSKYKTPIEEAANETETLNEVCKEKSNRVQIVEKEKKGLEEQKNKALAFVRDENELTTKQSALYQLYQAECEDNLEVSQEAVREMQAQLDGELGKHKGSEESIKKLEKTYKKGQKEYEALEKDTQAVLKDMAKCEKEKVRFEEKKKYLANKQKKLDKTLHASQLAASEAAGLVEKHEQDIERNGKEIATLEAQMEAEARQLTAVRDSMKGKTQVFSDAIAEKQASLAPWNEKISKQESDKAVAQSELDMLQERASSGQKSIEEAKARIEKIKEDRQSKAEELEAATAELAELEKQAEKLKKEIAKLAQKEPELRGLLSGARQKADEARSALQSSQSQGNVLNGLMRLKESGRIEGFHGRLGNLGTIDQKYDVAISTACPQLENLVGDTVEVGQQCIDYLRKNNLGRANIICLDRLARRDMSPIDTPENAPRLFDLVKPKHEMFQPAFYSVLQNTLVAKDLTQANRIAYGAKRWRVVTLDGQLIDVSGTMSGGGTRVAKGAMSSKVSSSASKDQVVRLEADREQLEAQYKELQDKQRRLEAEAKDVSANIPALETKIQKMELEMASLDKTVADSETRIQELSAEQPSNSTDQAQISKLEKQIAKIDAELEKLHGQTAGAEEEIKKLQDKIMEVGGVKLRMQKAKVDGLKEQMDTLADEISNAEVAKSKALKDKAKHDKVCEQSESDIASGADEQGRLDDEGQTLLQEAAEAKARGDEAQAALDAKKDELDDLKREVEEKTAELNETRAVEIEMRNKLDENQKIYAENEKRMRYWSDKLAKLALQSVSDLDDPEAAAVAAADSDSMVVDDDDEDHHPKQQQREQQLPTYTRDELLDMSKETLKAEIAALEEKTENASVDVGVLEEYRRRVQEHTSRFDDLQSAVGARDEAKKRCDDLRRLRLEGFMQGFSTISLRLKEMYQMITMGGNAELELVDSLDPFSEGILFSVMPPKKSWKNISNLSGGEKTLSSLALVFALHHYKPTPLYVMDEIDAALDFRNVSIVASYIKERTKNAQFVVISLRNNMFELAARLVGVYKVNSMTKSVTVENKDYIRRRAA